MAGYPGFVEGMFFLFLIYYAFFLVLGPVVLAALYWIQNLTTNRMYRMIILAAALVPGYFLMMNQSLDYIIASVVVIAPVVVFIAITVWPDPHNPVPSFRRIFWTYVSVAISSIPLLVFLQLPALLNAPLMYGYYGLSMSRIYPGILVLDTIIAFIIWGMIRFFVPPVKQENPA